MSLFYPAGYRPLCEATLHVKLPKTPLPPGYFDSLKSTCGEAAHIFPLFTDFSQTSLDTLQTRFYGKCELIDGKAYFKLRSGKTQLIPPMQSQVFLTIHRLFQLLSSLPASASAPLSVRKGEIQFQEQEIEIREEQEPEAQEEFHLPSDLWIEIFKRAITSPEDINNISQVSKLFYSLVNPSLTKMLANNPSLIHSPLTDPNLIDECIKRGVFHSELKQEQIKLTDEHLQAIPAPIDASGLTALTLVGNEFTLEGFAGALRGCSNIREIEFKSHHEDHFDDYILLMSEFAPQIEKIKIVDCPFMTDRSLLALMRCKKLKAFEYRGQQGEGQLTDYGLLPFLTFVELESIHLTGCPKVTQVPLITYIQNNPKSLTALGFSYCGFTDDRLFHAISCCSRLNQMGLGMPENQRDDLDGKKAKALSGIFTKCPLENVKIHDCGYLPFSSIQELIRERGPHLRRLDLQRFTGASSTPDPDIFAELRSCTELEFLSFLPEGSTGAATNKTITHLLAACAHLQTLEIAHKESSSSESIPTSSSEQFASGCHSLNNLTLHAAGERLEPALLSTLRNLNLDHFTILLGPSVKQDIGQLAMELLPKWKKLTQFHLRSMTEESEILKIDPSMLQMIPNLSELTLDGLTINPDQELSFPISAPMIHLGFPRSKMTDAHFIPLLTKTGRSLRSLDLEGCAWVNSKVLSDITHFCPNLEYINIEGTSVSVEEIDRFEQEAKSLVYLGAID